MKQHNGIRPQDIVILLKISAKGNQDWQMKDLASELGISAGEVSESLNRSMIAGFIASDKRKLMKTSILEFLIHGLKYVYPQKPGALVRGMPTAHSYRPLKELIKSEEAYVWQWSEGTIRGQSVTPLHPSVPKACSNDQKLHELLALTDSIRVGKVREQNLAIEELEKRILKK